MHAGQLRQHLGAPRVRVLELELSAQPSLGAGDVFEVPEWPEAIQ
jgi:hypothetical protein